MIKEIRCLNNCCILKYNVNYIKPCGPWNKNKKNTRAGVIINNIKDNTVLLIQSSGYKWGFPKGRQEKNETVIETALRELKEETGIILTDEDISKSKYIKINNNHFFLYKTKKTINFEEKYRENCIFNDVTGIGYFSLECLLKNKFIWNKLTTTCQKLIKRVINGE